MSLGDTSPSRFSQRETVLAISIEDFLKFLQRSVADNFGSQLFEWKFLMVKKV